MPTIAQAPLTFESGGKSIRLDAYLPDNSNGPLPAVIALYGAGGNVAGMERYAGVLASEGFAVYLLHYFDRTGTQYADKQIIFRNFPLWMKTLWDAISFVEKQPQVDARRIALLGFSLGAYLSLSTSAIDPRVKIVVEFFGGMPKEIKLFMRRLCPVLILHGEEDATYEIKIYPGVGHGFETETWKDAGPRALKFLQENLQS
jgi:dienelactone hydrolase